MKRISLKIGLIGAFFTLFSVVETLAQANIPFTQRKTWDGPFDIRMIAAPNLEAVYVDPAQASSNRLKADSIIRYSTMVMSGDLFEINNRYKGGSPFNSYDIPSPALACKDYNSPCTAGLTLNTPNSSCPVRYNNPTTVNKMVAMTYSDYDADMTTYSSSMSLLDISSCSEIESAYLYWTGNFGSGITLHTPTKSYTGNGNVFNVSTTSGYDKVLFKRPGGAYQNITAATKYVADNSYVCVADVTTQVKGTGGGQFWVANLQSYPHEGGGGSTSGWILVVVFRSPLSPPRLISLFDGFKGISSGQSETFNLTGLQAPATSDFKSYVGFGVLDGENIASQLDGTAPEGLGFKTNTSSQVTINPLCDGSQPLRKAWTKKGYPATSSGTDNINSTCKIPLFDGNWASVCDGISSSHITSYSEVNDKNGNEIVRLPSNPNTLGFDAHHVKLPDGAVGPGATTATLTVQAGPQGGTSPFMAYIAIERLQPKLVLSKKADKDQTATNVQRTYTFKIVNAGNQNSFGSDVMTDTLDPVTRYATGSITATKYVNGVASAATGVTITPGAHTSSGQPLSFSIPAINKKDSLEITIKVDVLPITDGIAGPLYTACKRTIINTAWVEYKKNVANEKLKSKSNSGECNDGSEVKVTIVDASLDPTAKILTPVDASGWIGESVLKYVRKEIAKQVPASAADTAKFLVYDNGGNRIYSYDVLTPVSGNAVYTAYRDLGGATCQEKIVVTFNFCTVPPKPVAVTVAPQCAGSSVTLTGQATPGPQGQYFWYSSATGGVPQVNPYSTPPLNVTTKYYLIDSVLATKCKSVRTEVIVQIDPLPTNPTAKPVAPVCPNKTAVLEANGTATGTFFWFTSATGGIPKANPFTTPALTTTTDYYLLDSVTTTTTHCKSFRTKVTVTVTPSPAAPSGSAPGICSGKPATFTATGTATGTFFWYATATGGTPRTNPFTTGNLSAATTYYLIDSVTSTGCASPRTPVTVAVDPAILAGAIGPDASLCANTAFTINQTSAASGGTGTYVYSWESSTTSSTSGFTPIASTNSTSYTASGGLTTTTYFKRVVSSGSCMAKESNVVTVSILPGLNPGGIGTDATICYNGSPTLTSTSPASGGNGSFSYQWESATVSNPVFAPIPGAIGLTYSATNLTQTTKFVRKVTSGTGTCSVASTPEVTITVHPNFTSGGTIQTDKATICSGDAVNISSTALPTGGTGSYTYTWSTVPAIALTNTSSDFPNLTLTAIAQTNFKIIRTATSGSCGSTTATVDVIVKPRVDFSVSLAPVADICSTDPNPVSFTATPSPTNIGLTGSYEWFIGTTLQASTSNTLSKLPSTLNDGDKVSVNLKPSADACPSNASVASNVLTLKVASKVIPTVTLTNKIPDCQGKSDTLVATAGTAGPSPTYSWTVSSDPSITSSTDRLIYVPADGDVVTVTVISNSSCKSSVPGEDRASASITLTVKPLVTPTVTITADKLNPCENDVVNFTITNQTNEGTFPTYKWYTANTGLQAGETGTSFSTSSLTGTDQVRVEMTSNAECLTPGAETATSNLVAVTVTPRVVPKTSIFANPGGTICAGESVTFNIAQTTTDTANGGGGVTYKWMVNNNGIVVGTGPSYTTTSLADGDNVVVTYTSSLRCLVNDQKTAVANIKMKVNTPKVEIIGVFTFCSDDNGGMLTAIDNGTGTDQVTGTPPTYTWTISSSPGTPISGATLPKLTLKDQDVVTVEMEPGYVCNGPKAKATQTITVYQKPIADITTPTPEICPGKAALLTVSGGAGIPSPIYKWSDGSDTDVTLAYETGTYTARITNGLASCYGEDSQFILVQDVKVNAGPDKSMFLGESVVLEGSSNGSYTYAWIAQEGFVPALSDTAILNPVATPTVTTTYKIIATSNIGCTAEDFVVINVFLPINIPNVFSPNGDGLNDAWMIQGIEKYPNSKVRIYNRWGTAIYSDNNGYRVPWEGTANGQELPTATYYYVIELRGSPDNSDHDVHGALTIVK